jgi:serine/threonine protein kinase
MIACPPDEQLCQLLAGELPAEVAEPLARHADGCAACQRRLGQLGEDASMSRWRLLMRAGGESLDATRPPEADPLPKTVRAPAEDSPVLRRLSPRGGPGPPPAPPGYQVLGELGRGGMGAVYKARHLALNRVVALKVIVSGAWAGPTEIARFRTEAEAVARLQHPNIVQIYEIGEFEGRPFFSLEYVAGGSLAERLDRRPLPSRLAAELVRTLALAIDAAHECGIVHRDLKPANILLVAGDSSSCPSTTPLVPKIADFGLAKRLGHDSGMTQTGMVVGTPSYMAPEQAQGLVHAVGPAADVYALGAILYECLTGRPPFCAATHLETIQQVHSQPPVSPRRLQPSLAHDLETVCLKCLEKEPRRRYASARALADDLERWLAWRPIQARPATPWERARKWAKRRPAVAALLSGLALALVSLITVLAWSNVRIGRQAEYAREQSRFAQGVVEDMYSQVAEEWLADQPEKDPLQKEFLGKALHYYEVLTREGDSEPEARRGTARAHFRMGQLYRSLNQPEDSAAAYRRAIALQERLRDDFPGEPGYRQDLANSHNWLGELLREGERSLVDAEENYRRAFALQEQLAQEHPGDPEYRRELARSHANLGLVEMDTERRAEAGTDYDSAVDLLEQALKERPESADYRHELARTYTSRGIFRRENGQLPEAEADYRRAVGLLEELRRTGRARTLYAYNLAIAYHDLGNLRYLLRNNPGALADLARAEPILVRLAEDFPARARYRKKLAKVYNSLGSVLTKMNRPDLAEANWTKARDLLTELLREDAAEAEYHADLGISLGNLGAGKVRQDDLRGGRLLLEEAVVQLRTALPSNPNRRDYKRALRNQYRDLAETLVRSEDRPAALAAATALAEVFPDQAQGYYYAACFAARCVALAEKEAFADAEARQSAVRRQVEQSVSLLRQALDKGLTGTERLKDDEQILRPLAGRPELDELKARLRPAVTTGSR